MKQFLKNILPGMFCLAVLSLASCNKIDTPKGTAKIYMPAALSNSYLVPGSIKNYVADKAAKKLHIPLYLFRSGSQAQEQFTVDIATDDATANKLISDGTVDKTKAMVAPAGVYSMPASANGGQDSSSFEVVFDANKLNEYLGKILVLSIRLTNPSKYQLNDNLSILNIVLDVDGVMLGAKTDVSDKYLTNTGHPFVALSISTVDPRRGVLAGWVESNSVKNFEGGIFGGWDNYGGGGFMSMERYGSPEIPNGKIYQTVKLPAGKYVLTIAFLDFGILDEAYLMAALGNTLPDISNINSALARTPFTAPSLAFVVSSEQNVSMGILANLIQDHQYFRIDKFRLYQYQSLF